MFVQTMVFGHGAANLHYDDILCIFNGYGDDNFRELYESISSGIDNELPRRFREVIGSVPGNHRILGHGWTLNESIPNDTINLLVSRYPGREQEIIKIWSGLAREWNMLAIAKTGLPKEQANALASLIYDIHLLGDLEPDNKMIEAVLNYRHLFNSIKKSSKILFYDKPQYAKLICERIDGVLSSTSNPQLAAQLANDQLRELHLGTMLESIYGGKLKISYSIDRAVTANTKNAMRRMRDILPESTENQQFARLFSGMMTPQPIPTNINDIQVVKGVLRKVENDGRKALVLELPFQFSVEQRAASSVAKKLILGKGYDKLTPEFLESVKASAKKAAIGASQQTGADLGAAEADVIADKAVKWSQISPKNAALKSGLITFVISEGISAYRYYESDLTEKELMFETVKKATSALAVGGATYCLVALGCTPTGPIVIGVGIGLAMITDFAFDKIKEEYFDPGFSLEDIIGGIPENLRARRTIWEPELDVRSFFDTKYYGQSILEPSYKKGGINNVLKHNGGLFDIRPKNKTIFDSKY